MDPREVTSISHSLLFWWRYNPSPISPAPIKNVLSSWLWLPYTLCPFQWRAWHQWNSPGWPCVGCWWGEGKSVLFLKHLGIINVKVTTMRDQQSGRHQCVFTNTYRALITATWSNSLNIHWSWCLMDKKNEIHKEERELICVKTYDTMSPLYFLQHFNRG